MVYRGDAVEVCEASCAEGALRAVFAPRHVKLTVADRSIDISDEFAMVADHRSRAGRERPTSLRISGRLVLARGVPRDDLGLWIELAPGRRRAGFRRLFGVSPVNLLEPGGLAALASLDRLVQRLRQGLSHLAVDVHQAIELGSAASGGLDKVLVLESADHTTVYVRRLFRDRARLVITAHHDGRIVVGAGGLGASASGPDAPADRPAQRNELIVRSRHGIIVAGDHLWFTDPQGTDLAKISIPWIEAADRVELARRIGQRIYHEQPGATSWPPRLTADPDAG